MDPRQFQSLEQGDLLDVDFNLILQILNDEVDIDATTTDKPLVDLIVLLTSIKMKILFREQVNEELTKPESFILRAMQQIPTDAPIQKLFLPIIQVLSSKITDSELRSRMSPEGFEKPDEISKNITVGFLGACKERKSLLLFIESLNIRNLDY